MTRTIVVGGGVGGLAVAIRLAAAGHDVLLVERNDVVGGKLATYTRDGYTFDIGPSLVTLPHLFHELFELAGSTPNSTNQELTAGPRCPARPAVPVPLGGWFDIDDRRRQRRDRRRLRRVRPGRRRAVALVRRPGSADLGRRRAHVPRRSDDERRVAREANAIAVRPDRDRRVPHTAPLGRHLLRRRPARPMGRTLRHLLGFLAVPGAGHARLHSAHRGALRVLVPDGWARHDPGCARTDRPRVRCRDPHRNRGRRRSRPTTNASAVSSSRTAPKSPPTSWWRTSMPNTSTPICSPTPPRSRRVRRAGRSTSGFAICAAVRGLTPGLMHHNVWFSGDERGEFEAIRRGELPKDPTIYGCVSAVTDPSQAPDGCENWFLLVNTPPGVEVDPERGTDLVLHRLELHGVPLRERIEFAHTLSPADIAARYRSPGGAIYGTSSDGRRAAFEPAGEPRHPRRAVPGRRVEPSRRWPAPRVDERPHRRRNDRRRSAAARRRDERPAQRRPDTWFAARATAAAARVLAPGPRGTGGAAGTPHRDAVAVDQHRRARPRRSRSDRPVARLHRRGSGCRRGDRRRRRIERRDGRAGRRTSVPGSCAAPRCRPDGRARRGRSSRVCWRPAREWVVTLDADTRPDPSLATALVARAEAERRSTS